MTDHRDSHLDRELSEDAAHRLLARAVELDEHRASHVRVAQLRDIALEAGISPRAFDEALAESQRTRGTARAHSSRTWFPRSPRAWLRPVLTNVLLLGGFWYGRHR